MKLPYVVQSKPVTIWYLCVQRTTGGRISKKMYKKKSHAHAISDAVWYFDRRDWFLDVWIERHVVETTIERIEVMSDGDKSI